MTLTSLPTTIGSIVLFIGWADTAHTEPFLYVTTLIPGAITETGIHDAVWADSYTDGEKSFNEADILAGNPEALYVAPEAAEVDMPVTPRFGQVVTYLDEMDNIRLTATFAPGIVSQDEAGILDKGEAYWVNSYGAYVGLEEILANSPIVHVPGL